MKLPPDLSPKISPGVLESLVINRNHIVKTQRPRQEAGMVSTELF